MAWATCSLPAGSCPVIPAVRQYEGPVATASHLRVSCFGLGHMLAPLGILPQPSPRAAVCVGLTSRGGTGMAGRCHRSWISSASSASMYRAYLARKHRHVGATAAGLRWAPSCIGLTSRGGTGMRDPPQLGFAVLPSQPRDWWLPGAPPSSCTLPPTSSPEDLATVGLSSRGGTARSPSKQLYFATYLSQRGGTKNPMAQDWHYS